MSRGGSLHPTQQLPQYAQTQRELSCMQQQQAFKQHSTHLVHMGLQSLLELHLEHETTAGVAR